MDVLSLKTNSHLTSMTDVGLDMTMTVFNRLTSTLSYVSGGVYTISPQCDVCGDRTTGKHYGAASCDGCKGFFRRSVRNNQLYTCRFHRTCIIDKDKRNQCRYCRLKKCFKAGMKREAVQTERDRISCRRLSYQEYNQGNGLSVGSILKAHILSRQVYAGLKQTNAAQTNNCGPSNLQLVNIKDIYDSIRQELLILVEWTKYIPAFRDLQLDDQVALVRTHAGEHLLLEVAKRSMHLKDALLLGNNCMIAKECQNLVPNLRDMYASDSSRIAMRIIDDIIKSMNDIQIDDVEFVCLKAIAFFNPSVKGLSEPSRIKALRYQIQVSLEDYMSDRQYDDRGRFGELLLAILPLQSMASQMIERLRAVKFFDTTQIDSLIQEMLLEGTSADINPTNVVPNLNHMNNNINSYQNTSDAADSPITSPIASLSSAQDAMISSTVTSSPGVDNPSESITLRDMISLDNDISNF